MSVKTYGIYEKGTEIPVMYVQCKTNKTACRCVEDYIELGRLSGCKAYEVRRVDGNTKGGS